MTIAATAIWRVRPGGNNANGGGFDPGIAGAGADWSQQDAPHVTFDGAIITAAGGPVASATITLSGYTVSTTDVGNVLSVTGGFHFTVGFYSIQSVNVGANTWTVDRNLTGISATGMTGFMGGAWADFWTNTTVAAGVLVPGNTVYIRGSRIPNSASYSFDYTASAFTPELGSRTGGFITFAADPGTPGYKAAPDTTGGMPCISCPNELFVGAQYIRVSGLWFVPASGIGSGQNCIVNVTNPVIIIGCVLDQLGTAALGGLVYNNSAAACMIFGCEMFSSVAAGTPAALGIIVLDTTAVCIVIGCNFHDGRSTCIADVGGNVHLRVSMSIFAKNNGKGISVASSIPPLIDIINNTIDGNTGNGIELTDAQACASATIINNIISNHVTGGTFGMSIAGAAADLAKAFIDYNTFYNNAADLSGISYGPHDTRLAVSPYVNSAIENYVLA